MKPVCYLHIGTHKTGTSSLQTLLLSNEACLERSGILIPRQGRALPHSGHHNLAWEMSGTDPRFNPAFGRWEDVLEEIRAHHLPAVCISSEDFEYLHLKPDALWRIRQMLNSIGYEVTIVVYLRPQADYIESLYVELLKNGARLAFRSYLAEIYHRSADTPRQQWAASLDYGDILDSFAQVFGADRMVVRPYRANRRVKHLLNDFISVISPGRRVPGLSLRACRHRYNPSLRFAQVIALLLDSPDRSGRRGVEPSILSRHFMDGRFDPLDLRDLRQLHRRYHPANQSLRQKYKVEIPTMTTTRLMRELACSAGLHPGSARRRHLLQQLDTSGELPQVMLTAG